MHRTATLAALACANAALAQTVPFTEDFATDNANWFNSDSSSPVGYSATGGPDGPGDSYATTDFNFSATVPGATPILFRGQETFGSSGGAFEGDWITAGVTELTFSVRHDGPAPIPFFVRYSAPFTGGFSPAAISLIGAPILPNTWTDIVVPITPSEFFIFEGPITFETVFSNIGRVQFGALVDAPYTGADIDVTFDIDDISIIPSPAPAAIFAVGTLFGVRRKRSA